MSIRKSLLVFVVPLIMSSDFINKNHLVFTKIELTKNIEIDTLYRFHNDSLLLININTFFGPFGDFTTHCGFIRNYSLESIIYKAEDLNDYRISKDYIAQINPKYSGKVNWGWYNVGNNGKMKPLPNLDKITDSIKAQYSSDYFVSNNDNGFFWVNKNGTKIKNYNYGNIILNDSSIDFDKLNYGLYKIESNRLVTVSDNPNRIKKMPRGLYYVPRPGIAVIRKYKIADIDSILMSYSTLSDCPHEIAISSSK